MSPCTTKLKAHAITNITTAEMMHLRVMSPSQLSRRGARYQRFALDDHRHRALDEALEGGEQLGAECGVGNAWIAGERGGEHVDELHQAVGRLDRRAAPRAEAQQRC